MTLPLWGLVCLSILALIHVSCDSFLLKLSVGNAWTSGPRDTAVSRSALAGRARRAFTNFLETAPVFICLALVAKLAGLHSALITGGIYTYLMRPRALPARLPQRSALPAHRNLAHRHQRPCRDARGGAPRMSFHLCKNTPGEARQGRGSAPSPQTLPLAPPLLSGIKALSSQSGASCLHQG